MKHPFTNAHDKAYLSTFRLPLPAFRTSEALPEALVPVWTRLGGADARGAAAAALAALSDESLADAQRAALTAGLACAKYQLGLYDSARQFAELSLAMLPGQWLAQRILFDVMLAEGEYASALAFATRFAVPESTDAWDVPLPLSEQHVAAAACAWHLGDWDGTAKHLKLAYPDGVESMPAPLQEDWFSLAFYREQPDDAAEVARELIAQRPLEHADVLLQALVQQGWYRQALGLYRSIYDREPGSELLRRRLVGLFIREGDVVNARKLMEQGALQMSAHRQ